MTSLACKFLRSCTDSWQRGPRGPSSLSRSTLTPALRNAIDQEKPLSTLHLPSVFHRSVSPSAPFPQSLSYLSASLLFSITWGQDKASMAPIFLVIFHIFWPFPLSHELSSLFLITPHPWPAWNVMKPPSLLPFCFPCRAGPRSLSLLDDKLYFMASCREELLKERSRQDCAIRLPPFYPYGDFMLGVWMILNVFIWSQTPWQGFLSQSSLPPEASTDRHW